MLDRYGEEIEADFQSEYQIDVVDFLRVDQVERSTGWRGKRRRSLRKFRALLDQLPSHGRYKAKSADDDEAIAEYMQHLEANPELKKQLEKQRKKKPTLDGYTAEARKLDHLIVVANFIAALVDQGVTQGKNKNNLPEVQPPETAADRWEKRQDQRAYNALNDEIRHAQKAWAARQERLAREAASKPSKGLPPRDARGRFVKRT